MERFVKLLRYSTQTFYALDKEITSVTKKKKYSNSY